jgi:hypothetical protein
MPTAASNAAWFAAGAVVAAAVAVVVIVSRGPATIAPPAIAGAVHVDAEPTAQEAAEAALRDALNDWIDGKQFGSISGRHPKIVSFNALDPHLRPARYTILDTKRLGGKDDVFFHVRVELQYDRRKGRQLFGVYSEPGGRWAIVGGPDW